MGLFQLKPVILHCGVSSQWKIECDALTDDDWECLAYMGMEKMEWPKFHEVIGVPSGGLRLAQALRKYKSDEGCMLLVDDVLTTGASMEQWREKFPLTNGLVAFARGICPSWITPIFQF